MDLNIDEYRPIGFNTPIRHLKNVEAYTYNQNLIEYLPENSLTKTTIFCQWDFLDNLVVDALENLYRGPPHAPELTVYPRPLIELKKIYQVKWASGVNFSIASDRYELGKNGSITFEEL